MKISIKNNYLKILMFLGLWLILSSFYDPIILPGPRDIFDSFVDILKNENILETIYTTFIKLLIGLASAIILGISLGLGMGINKNIRDFFYPFVIFLQAAPVISFILLALIWFDPPFIPIFVLCINSFPNMAVNVYEGINNIDKKLLEMSIFYRVDKKTLIKKLYIPSVISHILASTRIILSNAFKITVMAEVISKSPKGIGAKINWAWLNIETADILVWTLIIVILSFVLEKQSISLLKRRFGKYYG